MPQVYTVGTRGSRACRRSPGDEKGLNVRRSLTGMCVPSTAVQSESLGEAFGGPIWRAAAAIFWMPARQFRAK